MGGRSATGRGYTVVDVTSFNAKLVRQAGNFHSDAYMWSNATTHHPDAHHEVTSRPKGVFHDPGR